MTIDSANSPMTVTEGNDAVLRLTRYGDTTQPLTVDILVDDPDGYLRGNHWDPPPDLPTQVTFRANQSGKNLRIPVPDDHRDRPDGSFTVFVLPSFDYLIAFTLNGMGKELFRSVDVTDNDTPQELELNFGKDGENDTNVDEGDTLEFVVKRRQQDADNGTTATFTVRLETDRSGDDHVLSDWTEDTATGRLYKDYPLEITGSDLEVGEEFTVPENGETEDRWKYWASIRTLEDHEGNALDAAEEARYWTVKSGFRETLIWGNDSGASNGKVRLQADVSTAVEGGEIILTLTRSNGPISQDLRVRVQTWEPNQQVGFGVNPSSQIHWITLEPWEDSVSFSVYPYVDGATEAGVDQFMAEIKEISGSRYTTGNPYAATVEINDPPSGSALVSMTGTPASMAEGESATLTFTRSGGDTSKALAVDIRVDDPQDFLRGNHFDPAPDIPKTVEFAAGSITQTLTLTAPDDQRDLTGGDVTVTVLPGAGYLPGNTGFSTSHTVSVTDNDEAQELTFDWGWIDSDSWAEWEPGESFIEGANQGDPRPGPAEGVFYYDDDRVFRVTHGYAEERFPTHFKVKRRAEDVGKTASFVVRVEHNRGWYSPRHADWLTDPETGNRYKDFPLTLEGNQRQLVGRIEIYNNGLPDPPGWKYWATLRQVEDPDGVSLSAGQEAQYWTVQGSRTQELEPSENGFPSIQLEAVGDRRVDEGQNVEFKVTRSAGNLLAPLPVRVRTWEPNQRAPDGTNPTDQVHTIVLPDLPMTSEWSAYFNDQGTYTDSQSSNFTITVTDDTKYEPQDFLKAQVLPSLGGLHNSRAKTKFRILDDDQPTIALSSSATSITEGDALTFTLTRGNNTAERVIVGVSVDDPGGFLQGDYSSEAVAVPSSVVLEPGDATASITLATPDDGRDIPDSTLTFTVAPEPEYEIVGAASLTVQIADNDTAPQVQISFNQAEVNEGNDLILTITRTGEDKNDLEAQITAGPVGNQEYIATGFDPGQSVIRLVFHRVDDNRKTPDVDYEATLHPESPEFWVPTGPTTVNATFVDDDLYKVGIEILTPVVDEGQSMPFRLFHDGHTGETVTVNMRQSEDGSAVGDTLLGDRTWSIYRRSSYNNPLLFSESRDGSDGDATFTMELLPGEGYAIDPAHASATVTVRDRDPLPVLGFRDIGVAGSEGDGTIEFWVDIVSPLPSLRTVTVDYKVRENYTLDGDDIVDDAGTLTFAPGETSAVVEAQVLQDLIAETNDTFTVILTNPVNATLQDGQKSLTARGIVDDDEPTVTFEAASTAVIEGEDIVVILTRTEDTSGTLDVWLRVRRADAPTDLTFPPVTFPAGADRVQHTITTTDDDLDLGTYVLKIGVAHPVYDVGEAYTYRRPAHEEEVTVRDDELPQVKIRAITPAGIELHGSPFSQLDLPHEHEEGETMHFLLVRRGRGAALTVNLRATGAGDFITAALPTSATIPQGETTYQFEIRTDDDDVAETQVRDDLTLTVLDGAGYRPGDPASVTSTIFDNDGDPPDIGIGATSEWVNEGEDVVFIVNLDEEFQSNFEVDVRLYWSRRHESGTGFHQETEDVTLDFPPGTQTLTITRGTVDDSFNYGDGAYIARIVTPADNPVTPADNPEVLPITHNVMVWVQDDDRPTVTLGPATVEYDEGDRMEITLGRTGDTSAHLPADVFAEITRHYPAPRQDEKTRFIYYFGYIEPGDSSTTRPFGTTGRVGALGATGSIWLVPDSCPDGSAGCGTINTPHYCPDNPGSPIGGGIFCGSTPQYLRGSQYKQTFTIYNDFMGVRIAADQATVGEGDTVTFTLHRHGGQPDNLAKTLQVNVRVTQNGDYISGSTPQTVTFAAGQTTATLSVPTTNDAVNEPDGSITAELLQPTNFNDDQYAYAIGEYEDTPWEVTTVTTQVTDDDLLAASVGDATAKENEGTIEFMVSLDGPNTDQAATVDWATSDDGSAAAAESGADYTAASGTLNFAAFETEKTVTVTLLDDELDEDHETFNLVLSSPSNVALGTSTATGTILDDELAFAVIFADVYRGSVEEGEDAVLRVKRLPPKRPGETVSVDDHCYTTGVVLCFDSSPDADTGGVPLTVKVRVTQEGDFISGTAPATVYFEPGSVFAFLTIPTDDDATIEPDGTITAEILNGPGYSPLYLGEAENPDQNLPTAIRTVYDNDLTFSIGDAQAGEDARQLDFTVSLNAPAPQEVTIDAVTIDGDATSHANVTAASLGQDFEAKTETITFLAGEQTRTFSVAIEDDRIQERSETFTVQLSNPPEYSSLADAAATGTILDDEGEMVASVSRTYSIVDENQAGPVVFTVQLTHPDTVASERNPAVAWRTVDGTATQGEDYEAAGGKFSFPVGSTSGILEVDLVDDNLFEKSLETFTVELIATDSRLVEISTTDDSFETSIRDNESLTAAITADAEFVAEGGETTFTVTLKGGVTTEAVQMEFETSGDAAAVDDYGIPIGSLTFPPGTPTGAVGTLQIPAGQSSGTITYPILADGVEEDEETLQVGILGISSGARDSGGRSLTISQAQSEATTTILDQDSLTVSIEGAPSVAEGASATFTVSMSTASDKDVSVSWSTRQAGDTLDPDETALPDQDFTAESGTVAISAGNRSATFTVSTTQDTLVEGDETFRVMVDEATTGTGTPAEMVPLGVTRAYGTIVDNDAAPTGLSVQVSPNSVAEDAGPTDLTVTVALDGTTQFTAPTPVTVEMVNRSGVTDNAELGVDYTATTANTAIPAGQQSVTTTITITPVDDTYSEATEVARLSAKSPALPGSVGRGVNITDNDMEPVQVSLAATPDSIDESASSLSLAVTATLVGQSSRQIDTVVNLELAGDTATLGVDFQAAAASLTIPAGQMTSTGALVLTVLDDNVAEGSESLEVAGEAPGSIQVVPAEVTIEDNDLEPSGIGLSVITGPLDEGGGAASVPVQATLLGGGTRSQDTLITLRVVDLTATETDDYTASWNPPVLTIPAGEFDATATLSLTLVDDNIHEGPEHLAVRASNADPGLPVNGVRITIADNDPAPTTVNLSLGDDTLPEAGIEISDIQATLVGDSALNSDIEVSITIANSTPRSQPYAGGLLAPLVIAAGAVHRPIIHDRVKHR